MANRKLLSNILLLITTAIWGTAFAFQRMGMDSIEPAVASLLMSLEAVFAVLGGALILGERMTGREAIGCLVMFIAVILAQIPSRKK